MKIRPYLDSAIIRNEFNRSLHILDALGRIALRLGLGLRLGVGLGLGFGVDLAPPMYADPMYTLPMYADPMSHS